MLALAMLLIGAGVGVHVEENEGVDESTLLAIVDDLRDEIATRTGAVTVVDDLVWASCTEPHRCVDAVRARTSADTIVFVRVIGGPTTIRVIAERVDGGAEPSDRQATVDLERADLAVWRARLRTAAQSLFAAARRRADLEVEAVPPESPKTRVLPWLVVGASAAMLAGGMGFGLSSRSAGAELGGEIHDAARYDALAGRQRSHGIAANVLLSAAVLGVAASVALFIFD